MNKDISKKKNTKIVTQTSRMVLNKIITMLAK